MGLFLDLRPDPVSGLSLCRGRRYGAHWRSKLYFYAVHLIGETGGVK